MITTKLILKEGGKVLFTTILENHTMLEGKWGGPLFIARFFPLVRKLTYQYVCFTSYEATRLRAANEELPPESPKLLAAIEMANSLRESEEALWRRWQSAGGGEQPLPTTAFERDSCEGTAAPPAPSRVGLTAEQLAQIPIKDLEWNYVPEGLSMYPEGQTGVLKRDEAGNPENGFHPTNGCPTLEEQQDYGPIYALCVDLRQNLETFKNHIDALQRLLDLQMRLRHQRLRVRKELMGQTAGDKQQGEEANPPVGDTKPCSPTEDPEDALRELDRQVQEAEAERQAKVDHMAVLAGTIAAQEAKLHFLKAQDTAQAGSIQTPANGSSNLGCDAGAEPSFRLPYEPTMQACIAAYRTVVVKKAPLQELAAVATGSYKYPLFGRMRELLREMKEIKKQKNEDPHA